MRTLICHSRGELERAAQLVRGLDEHKPWKVTIAVYRERRSLEQNALLWALYQEVAKETGESADRLHEAMKKKFLPPQHIHINDEILEVPSSSAKLTVEEFSDFVTQVQMFFAGHGFQV